MTKYIRNEVVSCMTCGVLWVRMCRIDACSRDCLRLRYLTYLCFGVHALSRSIVEKIPQYLNRWMLMPLCRIHKCQSFSKVVFDP